jgi:hypothetical protein
MPVRLSSLMEQLGSHRKDFHDIWVFSKICREVQVSLKSDKNNGYFTWRQMYIFPIIPRSFLVTMRNVSDKSLGKNKKTFSAEWLFFPKIVHFMRFCWKILYSRTRHKWQYGVWVLPAVYLRLQTQIQGMWDVLLFHCNNGCTKAPQHYVCKSIVWLVFSSESSLCVEYKLKYNIKYI